MKKKKKHKHHKEKHKDNAQKQILEEVIQQKQHKDGEDYFYEDLKPIKSYISVPTLYKPARPKYTLSDYRLTRSYRKEKGRKITRYYVHFKRLKDELQSNSSNDFDKQNHSEFDLDKWITYINFKEENPVTIDEYQNAKSLLQIVEKSMRCYPNEDKLLEIYLRTIVKVYPIMDVLEIIEKMVYKGNLFLFLIENL